MQWSIKKYNEVEINKWKIDQLLDFITDYNRFKKTLLNDQSIKRSSMNMMLSYFILPVTLLLLYGLYDPFSQ